MQLSYFGTLSRLLKIFFSSLNMIVPLADLAECTAMQLWHQVQTPVIMKFERIDETRHLP